MRMTSIMRQYTKTRTFCHRGKQVDKPPGGRIEDRGKDVRDVRDVEDEVIMRR